MPVSASAGRAIPPEAKRVLRHDRFSLPVNDPVALRYYLDRLWVPHTRGSFARARIARLLARLGIPSRLIVAASGAVEAPAGAAGARLVNIVKQMQSTQLVAAGEARAILLADHDHSTRGKGVAVILGPGQEVPRTVVKFSTEADHQAILVREQEVLRWLSSRLTAALLNGVPRPLGHLSFGTDAASAESVLEGVPMLLTMRTSLVPRLHVERHFRMARDWLTSFQRDTRNAEHNGLSLVCQPLTEYASFFESGSPSHGFIEKVLASAHVLGRHAFPVAASHGDFWAGNIVESDRGMGVFDWEGFAQTAPVANDWLMFTFTYGLNYPWRLGRYSEPATAFAATTRGDGWFARLVLRHSAEFRRETDMTSAAFHIATISFLAQRALEEIKRLRAEDEGSSAMLKTYSNRDISGPIPKWGGLFQDFARAKSWSIGTSIAS